MTKLAIYHDNFHGKNSPNVSKEIHHWTISETIISMTILKTTNRIIVIFPDHFWGWDSGKFFTRNSSLDNFGNYDICDDISYANLGKIFYFSTT